MSLIEIAQRYVARGWSIIPAFRPIGDACSCATPCGANAGKHPATDGGWATYLQRLPSPDEISAWFDREDRNIAVVCGGISGGLVVVDCDDRPTYGALVNCYPSLGRSLRATTGRGVHIYVRANVPVRTRSWIVNGKTHHLKGDGSYVIAPPSLHASGRVYEWVDPSADLLEVDLERLAAAIRRLGGAPVPASAGPRERGWAARLFAEGSRKGKRDEDTLSLAGYFWRCGLPPDMIEEVLGLWAAQRCEQLPDDSWGAKQVRAKIRSVERMEMGYDARRETR